MLVFVGSFFAPIPAKGKDDGLRLKAFLKLGYKNSGFRAHFAALEHSDLVCEWGLPELCSNSTILE